LGRVEEDFAAQLAPGDTFRFAGLDLAVEGFREGTLQVKAAKRSAAIPSYNGARIPISSHLADRVRAILADQTGWRAFPDDVREWLAMQAKVSTVPAPDELLVESFPHKDRHYAVFYTFEGWPANQSLGMLLTRRMEAQGLAPLGFVANDYALAVWGLHAVEAPLALLSPDILVEEFVAWVENSYLLRRAFREASVISGLIERQTPGKRKTNRQVTFSSDLIYDVLRRYEPEHLLLQAAWADARQKMTDVERVAQVLERAGRAVRHQCLARVSPLAVPTLTMIGRESLPAGAADDALLLEAEDWAAVAMGEG
jgi:ATP-dependent Lhr-like helicase